VIITDEEIRIFWSGKTNKGKKRRTEKKETRKLGATNDLWKIQRVIADCVEDEILPGAVSAHVPEEDSIPIFRQRFRGDYIAQGAAEGPTCRRLTVVRSSSPSAAIVNEC